MLATIDDLVNARKRALGVQTDMMSDKSLEEEDMQGRGESEGGAGLDGMDEDGGVVDFTQELAETVKKVTEIEAELIKQRGILKAAEVTVYGIVYDKRTDDRDYEMWRELGEEEPRKVPWNDRLNPCEFWTPPASQR